MQGVGNPKVATSSMLGRGHVSLDVTIVMEKIKTAIMVTITH